MSRLTMRMQLLLSGLFLSAMLYSAANATASPPIEYSVEEGP